MGLLGGLDFETFYQGADVLMALRNVSWSEIKKMTLDEYRVAVSTMYENQPTVVKWLGRRF